ncbi:kinase-like domain-containing protein [Trichoderma chlorosporum]
MAHPSTLFHLVPVNKVARDALLHPDNRRFISSSSKGHLGLEVGFHVSSMRYGHVITRLGRDADLILRESSPGMPMSAVHVAFEINPATNLVVLSVRSKRISSVKFAVLEHEDDEKTSEDNTGEQGLVQKENTEDAAAAGLSIIGDGVILYTQDYTLSIASYEFQLLWLKRSKESFKALVLRDYQTSLQLQQNVRSRDRPTEGDHSEALSWHITRLDTAKGSLFKDIPQLREKIGSGAFGKVFRAVDEMSGNYFAIKVVKLEKYGDIDVARAMLHREIKVMERLRHDHIIEYLGHQHFQTLYPEIFMPFREGSITRLIKEEPISDYRQFCSDLLQQSLSGLDYLASLNVCHRDVKPDNILYYRLPDKNSYHFQIADFGLAHHQSLAKTVCGTGYYQAPELWPHVSHVYAAQSPKMDVFSLCATMAAVDCRFGGFPPHTSDYSVVLNTIRSMSLRSFLEPMARLHPEDRASAAQMLASHFNGRGLTTPMWKIPPIKPIAESSSQTTKSPSAELETPPQKKLQIQGGKARLRQEKARLPLIVYQARNPQHVPGRSIQPIRTHRDGIAKRHAGSRARPPLEKARDSPQQLSRKAYQIPGAFDSPPHG